MYHELEPNHADVRRTCARKAADFYAIPFSCEAVVSRGTRDHLVRLKLEIDMQHCNCLVFILSSSFGRS